MEKITADKVLEMFRSAENLEDIREQMRNVNYYLGNQWIAWNKATRSVEKLPTERNKIRLTFNKVQPISNALVAKHIKNKLKFNVVPGSREQEDIDAAKAADKYLDFLWDELNLSEKTKQIFMYGVIQKRCMVKTWYDPNAGDDISPTEDDGELFDDWVENGAKPINKGKIKARVCDPLTLFYDPSAKDKEDIRWVIERYAKDIDEAKEEYRTDDIVEDTNIEHMSSLNGVNKDKTKIKNMAIIMELWMKPCKKYPNGVKVTVCNGKVVDYNDKSGELPYELFGYIPTPGNLIYEAVVSNLIEPQKNYNIIRSMIATHAHRMGNSMWKLPTGTLVDEDSLTNEEGGIIEYNSTMGEPKREPAVDLPSFYWNELASINQDIDDASGSREVTQGRLPSGLDTLGGLELMVEQENEKLSIASQEYEQLMCKVLERVLRLVRKHFPEEQQIKILGEDNEIEMMSFNGSNLTGNEDIKIVQGSSLPEMKAAQQERIATMYKMGAIVKKDGTPDTGKFLRLMGLGNSDELFEQETLDANNAKLENQAFAKLATDEEFLQIMQQRQQAIEMFTANGVPVEEIERMLPPLPGIPKVWSSDDHEIHMREHNINRKRQSYRMFPQEIQDLMDKHYAEHEEALNAPMIQQQEMMQQQSQIMMQAKEAENSSKVQIAEMNNQTQLTKAQLDAQTKIAVKALR